MNHHPPNIFPFVFKMSTQRHEHIYKYFRFFETCNKITGLRCLVWNEARRDVEIDRSLTTFVKYVIITTLMFYLFTHAFYHTIRYAKNIDLVYAIVIPYYTSNLIHFVKNSNNFMNKLLKAVNELNVIDEILYRYHNENTAKLSTNIKVHYFNMIYIIYVIVAYLSIGIFFKYHSCMVLVAEFFAYTYLYAFITYYFILKSLFANRLLMIREFIRSTSAKAKWRDFCDLCVKDELPHNKLCDLHKIK